MAGALVANVRAGGVAEGGSTITMQLARNAFPDHLPASRHYFELPSSELAAAPDTTRPDTTRPDTLPSDTLGADTTRVPRG